jgi:hypothetical protein
MGIQASNKIGNALSFGLGIDSLGAMGFGKTNGPMGGSLKSRLIYSEDARSRAYTELDSKLGERIDISPVVKVMEASIAQGVKIENAVLQLRNNNPNPPNMPKAPAPQVVPRPPGGMQRPGIR